MMRASPFRYVQARTVADAAAALADAGPAGMLLAGGTDLVPNMKRRHQTPPVLVAIRRIPELRGVAAHADGGAEIGACATLEQLFESGAVAERYRALYRAAAQVATPLIRNMGTLGGNLCLDTRCTYYDQSYDWRKAIGFCMKAPGPRGVAVAEPEGDAICWVAPGSPRCWAVSSSDTAPALIALGARVALVSRAGGEREIALEDLYADDGMRYLAKRPDEILTAVRLPARAATLRSTYWKLRRRGSFDFPALAVAAALRIGESGAVEEARIALGAVASRPILVPEVAALVGAPLTDDAIERVADLASRHAKPLDNTDFTIGWRKRVVRPYIAGALRELRGDDPAALGLLQRRAAGAVLPIE